MKIALTVFSFFVVFSATAQISAEFSVGVLQSLGPNKVQLISSSTQAVGVYATTWKKYEKVGLRAREALSHKLTDKLSVMLQTGFNFRSSEYLWGTTYAYLTIPIQGGLGYKIIMKKRSVLSLNAFSGINIFKIQNQFSKQQTGFIQNGELSYALIKEGYFKSIIVKAGYEYQVDHETYFYKTTDPFFKDEDSIIKYEEARFT